LLFVHFSPLRALKDVDIAIGFVSGIISPAISKVWGAISGAAGDADGLVGVRKLKEGQLEYLPADTHLVSRSGPGVIGAFHKPWPHGLRPASSSKL
jgi:hypothetical protein